ncbi:hypothetical protein K6U06_09085 [Acidiferrimicrobium sp. IK]|uniref:hypothetical protein n=1 Tax=Acidiferrimicrobium sp. IK TaxID=2871700 RepID=UPI0021CAE875|nr:hypothetical protein [Acidiferrimicrobium sp. IK]MCU4184514.1 hypothetical protein [Acidiferrimicrobium sp. IK]
MIFYIVAAVVALFCAIALGLGPLVFFVAGAMVAVFGFRARRPRWWGLPLAAAGAVEAVGAAAGWRVRAVAEVVVVLFALLAVVRFAGHRPSADRRRPPPPSRGPRPSARRPASAQSARRDTYHTRRAEVR